jgi:CubicO group peptidase (beta-lactamase class C family)
VSGFVAPGFEPVRRVFESHLARGWDVGAGFAVYRRGELAVSLSGGVLAADDARPYREDTLQLVASSTKFVESMCVALLVDRGLVAYDDRIVTHWPSFARAGSLKATLTLRQLLMHRAGLYTLDRKLGDAELFDPDALARCLERQEPNEELARVEPGDGSWRTQDPPPPQAYHAITRGLYSSALLRRVDPQHRTLGAFFRDELAEPLGLDIWIGLPEREEPRVAPASTNPRVSMKLAGLDVELSLDADDPRYQVLDYERAFLSSLFTQPGSPACRALLLLALDGVPTADLGSHRKLRAYELPSSNGMANARSLAKLAALAAEGGTLDGKRLFARPQTLLDAAACAERYAVDAVMLAPVEFTQGGFARLRASDGTVTYGWGGAGGSLVRWAPELRLGCAYVTNTFGSRMAMHDPRANALLAAAIDCAALSR